MILAVLIVAGLTVGLAIGLILGWVVWPVEFTDTSLSDLAPEYKDDYIVLVSAAYIRDGDLEVAMVRLEALEVPNVQQSVSELTDRYINEGRDEADIQALVALAEGMGIASPQMLAYKATPTPVPTDTPLPTPTAMPTDTPTATSVPPTDTVVVPTATAIPPTDTPAPESTDTPLPTDTPAPEPTDTPVPKPTNPPKPTNTPKPTNPPAPAWTYSAQLMGPANQPNQSCEAGAQYIRAAVVDANGGQIGGVWLREYYTGAYQVSGHKAGDMDWGPGEAEFPCPGIGGGAMLCIAGGQGADCVTDYSRGMSCYYSPDFEDLWSAGYCECCEVGISKEVCQSKYYNSGAQCMQQPRHYSWRITFKRNH